VTVTHAQYGLMSHGRCFNVQYSDTGCYADVMSHVAGVCSGRRSCELQVDSLRAENCQRDFPFYLNASYSCVKGMRRHSAAAAAETSCTGDTAVGCVRVPRVRAVERGCKTRFLPQVFLTKKP